MRCGQCGGELLEGYIPTPAIEWVPKYGDARLLYRGPKREGFRLGRMRQFSRKKQEAWYCPVCDSILIPCKNFR